MKKLCSILLIALLFSCKEDSKIIITESNSEESVQQEAISEEPSTKKPLINIGKNDTLHIWVRGDGAPGMYLDTDNQLKGFYVDLEKAVMEEMGQKYKMHSYFDVGPVVQKIKDGEAHIALSVPNLPDYNSFLHLSDKYEDLSFVVVVQKDREDEFINKENLIESLFGKRVGVQTRGHIYQALREYKEIELVEYPTTTQALEDLNNGNLDAVPEVERIMQYYSRLNNWNLTAVGEPVLTQEICTGFSQALDYSVIERYNVALNTLIENGSVENLYNTHFKNN